VAVLVFPRLHSLTLTVSLIMVKYLLSGQVLTKR
jgi:hypothetical protein